MDIDFIYLLCLGLCLCYGDEEENEELPRPSISAWPSSVVRCKSNVTLRCWTHFQNITVTLGKLHNSGYQQELRSVAKEAEFHLTHVQPEDAGGYFCAYRTATSHRWSARSQPLQLVVTDGVGGGGGNSPRPSNSKLIILTTFSCLCISLLFVSICFIYRCTQKGSSHEEPPKSDTESDHVCKYEHEASCGE